MRAGGANGTTGQTEHVSQLLDYNRSQIQQFFIVGGELGLDQYYIEISVFLLVIYILVVIGNCMVCIVVVLEIKLHTPMYIFLFNLSFTDIIVTSCVLPKMISVGLLNDTAISFTGCFVQLNTYLSFQTIECIVLAAMAYDRYVAICNPLRYNEIVTPTVCSLLLVFSWTVGLFVAPPQLIPISRFPFCGDKVMFWFCDFPQVLYLACMTPAEQGMFLLIAFMAAIAVLVLPVLVIIFTYTKIIFVVMNIKSVDGRKKAFSTCSSHLIVVVLYYGSQLFVYVCAMAENVHPNVVMLVSILNCFITPFANPIIYSLRNKELKVAIIKHFRIHFNVT